MFLLPIATFPPFASCRTVPAVGVIWKEKPKTYEYSAPYRKKRSFGYTAQKNVFETFSKNLQCFRPRLKARFTKKSKHRFHGKKKRDTDYGYHEPEDCGTIEDCFDLPCPTFGFAVRYTFTRYTFITLDERDYNEDKLTKRQTGEGFRSAAPPDCRINAG